MSVGAGRVAQSPIVARLLLRTDRPISTMQLATLQCKVPSPESKLEVCMTTSSMCRVFLGVFLLNADGDPNPVSPDLNTNADEVAASTYTHTRSGSFGSELQSTQCVKKFSCTCV